MKPFCSSLLESGTVARNNLRNQYGGATNLVNALVAQGVTSLTSQYPPAPGHKWAFDGYPGNGSLSWTFDVVPLVPFPGVVHIAILGGNANYKIVPK